MAELPDPYEEFNLLQIQGIPVKSYYNLNFAWSFYQDSKTSRYGREKEEDEAACS